MMWFVCLFVCVFFMRMYVCMGRTKNERNIVGGFISLPNGFLPVLLRLVHVCIIHSIERENMYKVGLSALLVVFCHPPSETIHPFILFFIVVCTRRDSLQIGGNNNAPLSLFAA